MLIRACSLWSLPFIALGRGVFLSEMPKKRKRISFEDLIGAPEYLYHYTSISGVEGILKSKGVWASELHFLNDSREWTHAIEMAERQVIRLLDGHGGDRQRYQLLTECVNLLDAARSVCVFSMSQRPNQLSQWRAYCPSDGGYAIRFRTVHLLPQFSAQGFALRRCIYKEKEQEDQIRPVIGPMVEWLASLPKSEGALSTSQLLKIGEMIAKLRSSIPDRIAAVAPMLKHSDFEEEAEWRAIKVETFGTVEPEMGYHLRGPVAIPHYTLRLDAVPGEFPITEITVGPGPHQDLARRGLDVLLRDARVRISVSQTSLRSL